MTPAREVMAVYAAVSVVIFGLTRLEGVSAVEDYVHLGVGFTFLLTALQLAQRDVGGTQRYGIDLGGLLGGAPEDDGPKGLLGLRALARDVRRGFPSAVRETAVALGIAALIFPPFAVCFWAYHQPTRSFALTAPDDLASFALAQILVVGLPEEAFFRGYVQTRLTDAWPRAQRLLGARISVPAWLLQALLFSLIHFVVDLDPRRLAVFFPGLLFGWLRAYRGGIGAPIVMHALSNVYADLLMRGWL